MGKYRRFTDFIEARQKQLMDLKGSLAGDDYKGILSTRPQKPPTAYDMKDPLPYKAQGDDDDGKVLVADYDKTAELGSKSTPNMTPKACGGEEPEVKIKVPKHVKMTSEEFASTTKEMNDAEFMQFMLEHSPNTELTTITDLHGNEFTPDPNQTIQYLSGILLANERIMERFIREMKRRDGLKPLIEEVLEHGDSYDIISEAMSHEEMGPQRCDRLANSMNNSYMSILDNIQFESVNETIDASPASRFGFQQQGQQGQQMQGGKPKTPGGAFGGGGGPQMNQDPNYQGSAWLKQGGAAAGGGAGMGQGPSQGGMPPVGGQQGQQQAGGQQPQFMGQQPQMKQLQPQMGGIKKMVKYMGSDASDNLAKSMSGYDHMRDKMTRHCKDGNC